MPQDDASPQEKGEGWLSHDGYTVEELRLRQEAWAELEAHRVRLQSALSSLEEHSSSWEDEEE